MIHRLISLVLDRVERRQEQKLRHEFLPLHRQIAEAPAPLLLRVTTLFLLGTLVTALLWVCLAEIEVTVTATGRVVTTQPNISLSVPDGGVVKEVRVKPGDHVSEGQVLAVLDSTVSRATLMEMQRQLVSVNAIITRLTAERDGSNPGKFSENEEEDQLQRNLFDSRRLQFSSNMKTYEDDVRTLKSRLASTRAQAEVAGRQVAVQQQLANIRDDLQRREKEAFQREGVHRINALEAHKSLLDASRQQVELTTTASSLQTQIESRETAQKVFEDEWRTKIAEELVKQFGERQRLGEELRKAERSDTLTELTAPQNAVVLDVSAMTRGSVVRAAESLIELVPTETALVVDLDVPSQNIGRIRLGDQARIKLDALNFVRYGGLQGSVQHISGDVLPSSSPQGVSSPSGPQDRAMYRVRLSIDQNNLRDPPRDFQVTPGLSVTADIRVDRRVLVTYFTYPILTALHNSFKDPI